MFFVEINPTMETQLREFLMERNIAEDVIQKLEDENVSYYFLHLLNQALILTDFALKIARKV